MRLIFTIFALPFWVFLAAAGGLFYLGELSHRDTLAKNQEMAQALAGPPLEAVTLAEFSRDQHIGLANEIAVQGVINPDYNYELTKKRKGIDTVRYLFVLFDAADPKGSKEARGAMVLTEAEKDKFVDEYYIENSDFAFTDAGFVSVTTLNGLTKRSPDLSSMVSDAFEEQNLTKSANFIYVEPFLNGRAAGLTPTVTADEMRNFIRGAALGAALIGLLKFVMRRRKKAAESASVDEAAPLMEPAPQRIMADSDPTQDTDEAKPKRRKKVPIKLLAVAGMLGVAIYTGNTVFVIVAGLVALQIFAMRKTNGIITGAFTTLTGKPGSEDATNEQVLANVQDAVSPMETTNEPARATSPEIKVEMPNTAAEPVKRGVSLRLPSLRRTGETHASKTETNSAEIGDFDQAADTTPKRKLGLSLPTLRRTSEQEKTAVSEPFVTEIDTKAALLDETPKRGFKLSLPSFRRAPKETTDAPQVNARTPRKKEAFQAATLFAQEDTVEAKGMASKIQLLMARLTPSERTPKAFSDRPDPFDRLAADVQRSTVRQTNG